MIQVPNGWKKSVLGNLLEVQNGFAFDSDRFNKSKGMPLIRIRDLRNGTKTEAYYDGPYDEAFVVSRGDYLIGMDGEFRCYEWKGPDALLNQRVCRLRNFAEHIEPAFIFYGINEHLGHIEANTSYSTVKHISSKQIKAIEFAYPLINEQRRIVGCIKECLSRVDEVKRLREETRQEAKAIESVIFADFLEGSDYPQSVLGNVLLQSQYGTSRKASMNGKGLPVLRMGNIKGGHLDLEDLKCVELSENETSKYKLNPGDILINRTNSMELVGKSALFTDIEGEWVFASYLVRLVIDRNKALPSFVNAVINSRTGRNYIYATARRAIGMVNINAKEIAKMPLPLPPIEVQERIITKMEEAHSVSQALLLDLGLEAIESMSDAVLRKAFTGEL
jgi:type I restriction enzyme S subunit